MALHSAGETERALGILRSTHDSRPADRAVLEALTTILRDAGQGQEALGYAIKLEALAPANARARALRQQLE